MKVPSVFPRPSVDLSALDERAVSVLESGDRFDSRRFERELGISPAHLHAEFSAGRHEALESDIYRHIDTQVKPVFDFNARLQRALVQAEPLVRLARDAVRDRVAFAVGVTIDATEIQSEVFQSAIRLALPSVISQSGERVPDWHRELAREFQEIYALELPRIQLPEESPDLKPLRRVAYTLRGSDFNLDDAEIDNGMGTSGSFAVITLDGRYELSASLFPLEPDSADDARRAVCQVEVMLEDFTTGATIYSYGDHIGLARYNYLGNDFGSQLLRMHRDGFLLKAILSEQHREGLLFPAIRDLVYAREAAAEPVDSKPVSKYLIDFAFPMTDQAIELGFGASGCYTFALRGCKPQACESLNQAYRLAESVDMEPSESSIDHPSNADYLSAEMKNDLAPEPQCKSEDSPGPGM